MTEKLEVEFHVSYINNIHVVMSPEHSNLSIDIPIKEIMPAHRITVAEYFAGRDYDKYYSNFIVAGELQTGEMLLVPVEYKNFNIVEKNKQTEYPSTFVNVDNLVIHLNNVSTDFAR
jgi:hypothetical protein